MAQFLGGLYQGRSNETPGLKFGPTPTLGESQDSEEKKDYMNLERINWW